MGLRPPWSANICAPPHANCAPIGVWPTCVLRKWMGVCAKVSRRRFSGSPCGRAGSAREEGIARPEACCIEEYICTSESLVASAAARVSTVPPQTRHHSRSRTR